MTRVRFDLKFTHQCINVFQHCVMALQIDLIVYDLTLLFLLVYCLLLAIEFDGTVTA